MAILLAGSLYCVSRHCVPTANSSTYINFLLSFIEDLMVMDFREEILRNIISERVLESFWCVVMSRRLLLDGGVSGQ